MDFITKNKIVAIKNFNDIYIDKVVKKLYINARLKGLNFVKNNSFCDIKTN